MVRVFAVHWMVLTAPSRSDDWQVELDLPAGKVIAWSARPWGRTDLLRAAGRNLRDRDR
ncbi:hypothetical protein [Micromonospora palythoicola]|uniref:hypothetical protein n=1 Tax=Micromonospora palythoicola TaxID=3120507 RepID=UPI002FCDE98A